MDCNVDDYLAPFGKKLDGAELHGAKLFQRNCQNVPGAAGAAAGAAVASAAASAVCIYYVTREPSCIMHEQETIRKNQQKETLSKNVKKFERNSFVLKTPARWIILVT